MTAEQQIEPIENLNESDLWGSIGFHRPLAGFWYNLAFTLLHILSASTATLLLFPIMFPYPEIDGYFRTATGVFSAIFIAFDLGTANMMGRFIGETSIKNPQKMVQYIQYFIWYQMFSGLIQVTGIAVWALCFPPQDLIFLVWIMLVNSTTQYPAMQGVFKSALQALQQFDKSMIISFIQGDVFQRLTEIIFVVLFRYTLGQNPQIGTILAASIGLCLGVYLDDFIAMLIGMSFFKKAMSKYGVTIKDCFRHDFGWDLIKECLLFGFKTGIPSTISGFIGLLVLTWWLGVPQYTTFVALEALARSIVNFIQGLKIDLGGGISESYLNDKKALCQYYVGQSWRFDGFMQIMLYSIILVVSFILEPAFIMFGLDRFVLAIPFIIPTLIRRFTVPYEQLADSILTGTNHPNIKFIIDFIGMAINLASWYLFLIVFQLPQIYGFSVIVWLMPMGDLLAALVKMCISYFLINKRILSIKIPIYQTFIGPGITGALIIITGYLYVQFIFNPMQEIFNTLVALIPMALIFVFVGPIVYFILTVLLGVWDDGSIDSFKKASEMSGIARFITRPLYKILLWAVPKSKFHNKFSMESMLATKEARELMILKQQNLLKT